MLCIANSREFAPIRPLFVFHSPGINRSVTPHQTPVSVKEDIFLNVQEYVLRDTLKLGVANTKALWERLTISGPSTAGHWGHGVVETHLKIS